MEYRTIEQWSLDQANAEQALYSKDLPAYRGPLLRWAALRELDALEREYIDSAQGFTILAAVRICANRDIVMPDWLARAFISRYDRVLNCNVDSWDEAFDRPYPKGAHINALRKQRNLKYAVSNMIADIRARDPSRAIDKELFTEVGAEFSLGATLAEKYYYLVQNASIKAGKRKVSRPRLTKSRK